MNLWIKSSRGCGWLYKNFENLTEEKKKRIIDVCIEEFSQNGYKNASTNNIVKNADISKGILFHYFGNKRKLYLYVLDYVTELLNENFYKEMEEMPVGFFERMTKIGIVKLKIAYENPLMYKLILDAYMHSPDELKTEIQERHEKMYKDGIPIMFNNIDTTKFRKNIDQKKATETILFVFDGISNKYLKSFENKSADEIMSELKQITKEFNEYVEILKNGIY